MNHVGPCENPLDIDTYHSKIGVKWIQVVCCEDAHISTKSKLAWENPYLICELELVLG
jgi:hypothetical protein